MYPGLDRYVMHHNGCTTYLAAEPKTFNKSERCQIIWASQVPISASYE